MRWLPHLFLYSLALQTIHSPVSPLIKDFELRVKQPQVRTIFYFAQDRSLDPNSSVVFYQSTLLYFSTSSGLGHRARPLNL